ncbi:cardiolipin synthase [Plasticicumulans acidivorans]|uniref:CDP-diacylglycerol--glycerol-3-phosphate 3-phosphatidyltransferase n=1 Tax=Plasticicumulans acidivorans TaxID=886464 RepID=A0A317N0G0_9GAMM|nr:cardiolipin synthase [Plasticicumulans acidivorans]
MARLELRHLPNLITVLRILLVPPLLWLLLHERFTPALLLFVLAGVSDALDGALAKGFGWTSRLGGILDPIADKLLLVGCFLVLGLGGELPLWLMVLVIGRDLLIIIGAVAYQWLIEDLQAAPTWVSKCNTLAQLTLIFALLLNHGAWTLPPLLLHLLIYVTALLTLWSGFDYVQRWGRKARQQGRRRDGC